MDDDDNIQLVLDSAVQVPDAEWLQAVEFYHTIDPTCVSLLSRILREFPYAHILLISEQRRLYRCGSAYGSPTHLDNLARHLIFAGLDVRRDGVNRIVGILPANGSVEDRPRQIQECAAALQYEHILVVDDADPGYHEAQMPFVRCVADGFDVDCYFSVHKLLSAMGR